MIDLDPEERALLSKLPALVGGVGADADDPASLRMRPDAYPEDSAASWEFTRMTDETLDDGRRNDGRIFSESLEAAATEGLSVETTEAWLRVIGDARLTLASREGIGRDDDLPEPSVANPRLAVVHYLGGLQHGIVEVLLEEMADK